MRLWRTIDCVVGGLTLDEAGAAEALLFGLYDGDGALHFVGSAPLARAEIPETPLQVAELLLPLSGGPGFSGRRAPLVDRFTGRRHRPIALEPRLVAEVTTDHISEGVMRHGARVLRWRTDKAPDDCTLDQIQ